jgi:formamidopyrimidine-DNA glycosylase
MEAGLFSTTDIYIALQQRQRADRKWRRFDAEAGVYGRWFVGAECNTCHNAVDRHVAAGRADQVG